MGKIGPLKYNTANKNWTHRRNHYNKCRKNLQPHDFHPIFYMGAGSSRSPLHVQASILLCAAAGVKEVSAHFILDGSKKQVETVYKNLELARSRYVKAKEKVITYGDWRDVEVDEVDVENLWTHPSIQDAKNTTWEQWGGMIQRGNPSSLRLFRLNPKKTKQSAPGPGPIRKCDWGSCGQKVSREYERGASFGWCPRVRHEISRNHPLQRRTQEKKETVKGKGGRLTNRWKHEVFLLLIFLCSIMCAGSVGPTSFHQELHDRHTGQGQDDSEEWHASHQQVLGIHEESFETVSRVPGNDAMTRKSRSSQIEYWHRRQNMWKVTGKMLRFLQDNR